MVDRASATAVGQTAAGECELPAFVESLFPAADVVRSAESDAGFPADIASLSGPFASQATLRSPNCRIKRVLDFVIALTAIAFLLPLLVGVAIAVAADASGPVFFRQWRGGRNGQRFQIWKFRTMTCLEDGTSVRQARRSDARVTRIGRILRKTSLDELPQLFNVLKGDMSLVGPRPHALVHDTTYSRAISGYEDRQSVRPGMTGWAQVNGCRGETRDIAAMQMRVERDLEYIRHWSLRFDLVILVKTVNELLRSDSAY
jgi:putative colanic acid biosynthesis UDP-glucose lipid carrier transferase